MGGSTADLRWKEVKDKDLVEVLFELDIYKFGDDEIDNQEDVENYNITCFTTQWPTPLSGPLYFSPKFMKITV